MITKINELKQVLENKQLKSSNIDIKKLEEYATGILIVCAGEYGYTYYHEETDKVFIMLGDANPFDEEYLKQFMLDDIKKSYKVEDNIQIQIEYEAGPTGDGWVKWNGKKWESVK
jgi:hypothetical protein